MPLGRIVRVMTFLAERGQVVVVVVGRVVVQVRDGEDDLAPRLRMRPVVGGGAPFAAVASALEKDTCGDLRLVGG